MDVSCTCVNHTLRESSVSPPHHIAGVDIARLDNPAPYRRGGHRETGQPGTISQGWTSRDLFIVQVEAQYKLIFAVGSII